MNRLIHKLTCATVVGVAMLASSCSLMEEEIDECPTGLFVRFVYDYNIQRADMFKDHVGHVTLYLYDEEGRKVAEKSVSNTDADRPLSNYGYTMHLDPAELAPGRYRLLAVAMQADWSEAMQSARAHYLRPAEHSAASDFIIKLEHSEQPDPAHGRHAVEHSELPLDTLWHTLKVMSTEPVLARAVPDLHATSAPYSVYPIEDQWVTVENGKATYATVSMIRNTKHLNITMRQLDNPADMQHDDYEVYIDDSNTTLDHDNSVMEGNPVRYTPFAYWTTRFSNSGVEYESGNLKSATPASIGGAGFLPAASAASEEDATLQRTAHYNLMYNRLMHHYDPSKCAVLYVRNKNTGKEVAKLNLPYILSEGRTAYQTQNYSHQEYLDREYDYHLDFLLRGDTWEEISVCIDILSWSKRIQHSNLE